MLAARLLVPLAIPRFPLPAVISALVLDAVDHTVFQTYTNLGLEHYQGYDKALDIHYLSIAYIATLRNWTSPAAFAVGRFLYFYRLVGVVVFAMHDSRAALLIFANTFEYFFILYELTSLRWDPLRLSRRLVLGAAAFLWIVIKLPQEYWIHVAQIDTTDLIKEAVFGRPADTPWSAIVADHPGAFAALAVLLAAGVAGARWAVLRWLPPPDRPGFPGFEARPDDVSPAQREAAARALATRLVDGELVEKVAMVGLVGVIFAQAMPGVVASDLQIIVGAALVITLNTALSEALVRRGLARRSAMGELVTLALVNGAVTLAFRLLLPAADGSMHLGNALFFSFLLIVLVVLYDRYRPLHEARRAALRAARPARRPDLALSA